MKATTKERRDEKALSGYLRCFRVDLLSLSLSLLVLPEHSLQRYRKDMRVNCPFTSFWRRPGEQSDKRIFVSLSLSLSLSLLLLLLLGMRIGAR